MKAIKVLIIDKEAEFASILTDRLNSWGLAATAAASGTEALDLIDRVHPNVVVLGIEARNSGDLEMLTWIRARYPAIKVILLAGKGAAWAAISGMEHGVFDVLSQPIELGVLIDTIRKAHRSRHNR